MSNITPDGKLVLVDRHDEVKYLEFDRDDIKIDDVDLYIQLYQDLYRINKALTLADLGEGTSYERLTNLKTYMDAKGGLGNSETMKEYWDNHFKKMTKAFIELATYAEISTVTDLVNMGRR